MNNVVSMQDFLSAIESAQEEKAIADIQGRVSAALKDSDDPKMAVYALLAAALCITPQGDNQDWRSFVVDAFLECCAIIPVEQVNDEH